MRIIALLLMLSLSVLAACQDTGEVSRSASSTIASAIVTNEGILVVTAVGNRHVFTRTEICQGQTWMLVGPERFALRQTGNLVSVDGVPIEGLRCPPRANRDDDNNRPRETPEETRDSSGEMDEDETQNGNEGVTDSGQGTGIRPISG
jgi:hypothetical protein